MGSPEGTCCHPAALAQSQEAALEARVLDSVLWVLLPQSSPYSLQPLALGWELLLLSLLGPRFLAALSHRVAYNYRVNRLNHNVSSRRGCLENPGLEQS